MAMMCRNLRTDTGVFCVMATVVNERTNVRLSVPLVNADGSLGSDR